MGYVLATGNFDGWHLGHHSIYEEVNRIAKAKNLQPLMVSFAPHTSHLLNNNARPLLLTTSQEKQDLFKELKIPHQVLDFTKKMAGLDADVFIREVIIKKMRAKAWVFGANHRFGRGGLGDFPFVKEKFPDMPVYQAPFTKYKGEMISSSRIRALLVNCDLDLANKMLGRAYSITGKVVKGFGRGAKIGFPTANLEVNVHKMLPGNGVYGGIAIIDGKKYRAVTNIGERPTFSGAGSAVEVHLIDDKLELYDKIIEMKLNLFIRREKKSANVDELRMQIARDVQYVQTKTVI